VPSLREHQEALRHAILGDATLDGGAEIYRYAYRARLEGALRQNYPALARRVGEDAFRDLARAYAREFPSRHYNIRWHGAQLWRLLDGAHADLARMEWALGVAFDAADAAPLDWNRLRREPLDAWAGLPLALHPSTQVLAMSWAVEPLREGTGEVYAHEHVLIVWRKGLQAHWRIAESAEGTALRALGSLGTLQATCEAMPDACIESLGAWLAGWVAEGMLAAGTPGA
jgi:Putative DNA-binding domain